MAWRAQRAGDQTGDQMETGANSNVCPAFHHRYCVGGYNEGSGTGLAKEALSSLSPSKDVAVISYTHTHTHKETFTIQAS